MVAISRASRLSDAGGVPDFPHLREFLESRRSYSPNTHKGYVKHLSSMARHFPSLSITHPRDVAGKLGELIPLFGPVSPQTVSTHLSHLRTYLRWCRDKGYISSDPRVRVPTVKALPKSPPDHEVELTLRGMKTSTLPERDVAILRVMAGGGLRVGEVISLRLTDYRNGRLTVRHPKNGRDRVVPLGKVVVRAVEKWLRVRDDPSPYLFTVRGGGGMGYDTVRHLLRRCNLATGLHITPHQLRHHFATRGLRNGVPLFVLQEYLGHSTLEMVRRYSRVVAADLERYRDYWD